MPEYLAPGVYVEETSYRTKSIEGQSTSTAGFIGPTRFGPTRGVPEVLTSFADFERIYGGMEQLEYGNKHNYVAHAIRAFFAEGGGRLYFSRTFLPKAAGDTGVAALELGPAAAESAELVQARGNLDTANEALDTVKSDPAKTPAEKAAAEERVTAAEIDLATAKEKANALPKTALAAAQKALDDARTALAAAAEPDELLRNALKNAQAALTQAEAALLKLHARYPGAMGNMRITVTVRCGLNILGVDLDRPKGNQNILRGVRNYDLVWVTHKAKLAVDASHVVTDIYWLDQTLVDQQVTYLLRQDAPGGNPASAKKLSELVNDDVEVHVITLNVAVAFAKGGGQFGPDQLFPGLSLHPEHASALSTVFAEQPGTKAAELYVPLVVTALTDPFRVFNQTLLSQKDASGTPLSSSIVNKYAALGDVGVSFQVQLANGNDGIRPTLAEYEGDEGSDHKGMKSGLFSFQDVDDISIVAAPGSTYSASQTDNPDKGAAISRALLIHCTKMRYRAAVLDAPNGMIISEIRAYRSKFDSTYGALYYPWIRILDPVTQTEISLPPSGFVAGIWARTDGQTGVHKAPANQEVRLASGLEIMLNKGQQDVLNPEGINCFRSFEGRGIRLWGARTISSDSEWKYVNLRRYFAYLEHSIDKATQWVVFESNGPTLWDKVKTSVEDFLFNEWKNDRLLGAAAAEAYFVRCDKSTMSQNDLDNGRLIVHVGVSPLRPAEFVIFQVGQWTATK